MPNPLKLYSGKAALCDTRHWSHGWKLLNQAEKSHITFYVDLTLGRGTFLWNGEDQASHAILKILGNRNEARELQQRPGSKFQEHDVASLHLHPGLSLKESTEKAVTWFCHTVRVWTYRVSLGLSANTKLLSFHQWANPRFKWVFSTMGKAVSRDEAHHPCGVDRARLIQFDVLLW